MENKEQVQERSKPFPSMSLKESIKNIDMIKKAVGRTAQDKMTFAKAMGYKGISGPYLSKFASLLQFGLVAKNKNGQYFLSESAQKILTPLKEAEKVEELLTAFKRPLLFSELLNGELANQTNLPSHLETILHRKYGITEKSAKNAAHSFIESGTYAGIFTESGAIVLDPSQESHQEQERSAVEFVHLPDVSKISSDKDKPDIKEHRASFPLSEGMAYLQLPGKINKNDIAKIRKHIEMLELDVD